MLQFLESSSSSSAAAGPGEAPLPAMQHPAARRAASKALARAAAVCTRTQSLSASASKGAIRRHTSKVHILGASASKQGATHPHHIPANRLRTSASSFDAHIFPPFFNHPRTYSRRKRLEGR